MSDLVVAAVQMTSGEDVEASKESATERLTNPLRPEYGPDVRVSNPAFAGNQKK